MRRYLRKALRPAVDAVERRELMAVAAASSAHVITTQIGVGSAFGPFLVNPTTPRNLDIYVFSEKFGGDEHAFRPAADIAPRAVMINGVVFHDATVRRDPVDENKDGIPDAIVTIHPRSDLDLTAATTALTIEGTTRPRSPSSHRHWGGSAAIRVTGSGAPGSGYTYPAYVAVTLPTSYGGQFVNTYIVKSGWNVRYMNLQPIQVINNNYGSPFGPAVLVRFLRGSTFCFSWASGTYTNNLTIGIPLGSAFTFTGSQWGSNPMQTPDFVLTYTGSDNTFTLTPGSPVNCPG